MHAILILFGHFNYDLKRCCDPLRPNWMFWADTASKQRCVKGEAPHTHGVLWWWGSDVLGRHSMETEMCERRGTSYSRSAMVVGQWCFGQTQHRNRDVWKERHLILTECYGGGAVMFWDHSTPWVWGASPFTHLCFHAVSAQNITAPPP